MKKSLWLASASLVLLSTSAASFAQDNSAAPPAGDSVPSSATQGAVEPNATTDAGEIIVTATRRAQALSDVPIAVSAVSGAQLQNSGVTDIRQLNQLSPSLLVSSTTSEAGAGVARIRGIGTVGDNPGLESSVAVFIDGVYRSRTGTGLTELGEVERIEVLRGPQGTLFGRNASAGLINVITKKPSFENEGYAEATYGNYDYMRLAGGVTGPIIEDSLAYRIEGIWQQRDGFIKDVVSGRRINDRDRWLVRGQLLAQPNDDLEIRIIGDYAKRDEECCGATYLPTQDVTRDANGNLVFGPSRVRAVMEAMDGIINDDTFSRRMAITPGRDYRSDVEDWGVSAEANWDLGIGKLTSITAYRDWKWIAGQDADFNNLDILYRDSDGGYSRRFQTFSQELRLQGTAFDNRLDWLVGGYFAHEKLKQTDNLKYGADYETFAGCRLIAGLTDQLAPLAPFAPSLRAAFNPALARASNCFNVPRVASTIGELNAIAGNAALPASVRAAAGQGAAALGATIANPARPGFGSVAAVLGQPGLAINNTGVVDTMFDQTSRNFAIFTHNVFKITDDLSLTLGLRYTNERKELDATINNNSTICSLIRQSPLAALQALPCVISDSGNGIYTNRSPGGTRKEDEWSGTAVLSYKVTPDLLAYASYSKGYKAGGFNLDSTNLGPNSTIDPTLPSLVQLQFEPEKVDAFEIGAKFDGRAFNLNAALFYQEFKNFQLNTYTGTNFIVDNINGCDTDLNGADTDNSVTTGACPSGKVEAGVVSKGVEIEALLLPTGNVTMTAGFTLADTKYRNDLVGADGRPLVPQLFQLPGNRLSNAPEYVVSGSAAWEPRIGTGGLRGLLYADFRYQSEINTGSDLDPEKNQEGVMVVNARVGISGEDRRWSLEFWAQNLFNVGYQQVAFDAPVQGGGTCCTTLNQVRAGFYQLSDAMFASFLAEPRTYGITVRTRF